MLNMIYFFNMSEWEEWEDSISIGIIHQPEIHICASQKAENNMHVWKWRGL